MSDTSYESVRNEIFSELAGRDVDAEQYTNALKALEILNKAEAAQCRPETPEQCESGPKAWFKEHSDALIKAGGTICAIVTVGFVESKFDVIFRSKASKYL